MPAERLKTALLKGAAKGRELRRIRGISSYFTCSAVRGEVVETQIRLKTYARGHKPTQYLGTGQTVAAGVVMAEWYAKPPAYGVELVVWHIF